MGRCQKIVLLIVIFSFPSFSNATEGLSRLTGKIPYKAQWVSVVKKGKIFKYKRQEGSSPRTLGDKIFVGSDGGYFYAMKKKNGRKIWRFKSEGSINSAPTFWGGSETALVFFGDDEAILYALRMDDGKEVWRAHFSSEILTAPTVLKDRVFVATVEGQTAALRAADGHILWQHEHPFPSFKMSIRGNSPPVLDERGERIFVGFADGVFQALAASSGKVLWEKTLGGERGFQDIDGMAVLDKDRLYLSTFDGSLFALSKSNGRILWRKEIGSGVRPLFMEGVLYVSGSNGFLYALNSKDGSLLWGKKIGSGALTAPVLHNDVLTVGLSNQTINFLDRRTGKILAKRWAKKGIFSDPIVVDDRIYYLSNGGRLYSLQFLTDSKR